MRIYVTHYAGQEGWWATAPEVPGTASEDAPSREEALARCRQLVADERAAFARLGHPLEVDDGEEIIEWLAPWWLIPEWLVPVRPRLLASTIRRMDELADEVEEFLDEIDADAWDRSPESDWSVRRVLDHIAGGFGIGVRRLEPWPLDPRDAQAAALEELRARLSPLIGKRLVVEQSGMNQEIARVRWTPRKVARVVRGLQEAWAAHVAGSGPRPAPALGHDDEDGDNAPIHNAEIGALVEGDRRLRDVSERDPRVREIALSYRYYRDRLIEWPIDSRERWRAMRAAFRDRLMSMDESDLALVRLAPNRMCVSVAQNLGLGISHVREHLDQMRRAKLAIGRPA